MSKLKEDDLTLEFIKECFTYHEDGYLIWKTRPVHHFKEEVDSRRFNTAKAGKVAGYFNKRSDSKQEGFGYWRLGITWGDSFSNFKIHRIIWFLHKGFFPKLVDHKDTDTNNNRISNLRDSDVKGNSHNTKTPVNNNTGYKGVSRHTAHNRQNKPFRSCIEFDGYTFGLGNYVTAEDAACAYNIAAKLLFKTFANINEDVTCESIFTSNSKFFTQTYFEIEQGIFDWDSKSQRKPSKRRKSK